MDLLRPGELEREPDERVFRHSRLGGPVMAGLFATPLAFVLARWAEVAEWFEGAGALQLVLAAPFALFLGPIWLLLSCVIARVAWRGLLPSNWLVRVSPGGVALNLRSYQNAHFPDDSPTVVRLAWREVARVREVRDATPADEGTLGPRRWVQLELAGVDSAPLERAATHENVRPGPERSFLGVRTSGRSLHVPVHVPEPGVVRIDWLGRKVLRALGRHLPLADALVLDASRPEAGREDDLGERLRALARGGRPLEAIRLARAERGLSLAEARAHVEALAREPA